MIDIFNTKSGKIIGIGITVSVLSEILWQTFKKYTKYKKRLNYNNATINKVIFFDGDGEKCSHHANNSSVLCYQSNCPVKSLEEITSYIDSATESLDICVYFITFSTFGQAIIKAFKKGVRVRIISDFDMTKENCDQILKLKSLGIKIRSKKMVKSLMHHKFVIIDNNLLINGSTNWTYSAFFANFENVTITNQYDYVKAFSAEFEKLWILMDD